MQVEQTNLLQIRQRPLLPDWEKAKTHANAVSVGDPNHTQGKHTVCDCCKNVVQRKPMDLGTNIKKLSFLGFGVPLYFLFLQYCIILNLLLVLTDGIMMTTEAIQHNSLKCIHPPPTVSSSSVHHFMYTRSTHFGGEANDQAHKLHILCSNKFVFISNVNEKSSTAQTVARMSSFIIQVLFLIYVKNSVMKTGQYYNEISVDLSDYSVIFKGLPIKTKGKKSIFDQMIKKINKSKQPQKQKQMSDNMEGKVDQSEKPPGDYYQIIIVPQNQKLEHLLHKKEELNEKYLKLKVTNTDQANIVLEKYEKNQKQLKEQIELSKNLLREDKMESENVIIVFQTEKQRQQFMKPHNQQIIKHQLVSAFSPQDAQTIEMSKCSDPKQIMWHHLQHFSSRKKKIIIGWLLSFVFLFVFFIIFYFLSTLKANLIIEAAHAAHKDKNNPEAKLKETQATIIAWATLIGIVLFNKFVMGPVLHYFTHLQHHDDKANDDFSFAFKYALGMFFTTCLMTITIQAFIHKNYYSHPFGIIQQESLMFIFSSILVPLIWLIHPYQLAHCFSRWRYQDTKSVTQKQANYLMADYQYSVGKRYAQILEMMWFAFLYVDLIPAGTMAILVGVCAYYWVDKYNLLNRSSAPHNISANLTFKIVGLLDLTLVFRFAGEILFDYHIKGKVDHFSVGLLIFSIVFMLLPWREILDTVAGEQFKVNEKTLSVVYSQHFLQDNYIDKNPIFTQLELTEKEKQQLIKMYSFKTPAK